MQLLTAQLLRRFAQVGSQEGKPEGDVIVVAKYFTPDGGFTFYATEYDPELREFFGLVECLAIEFASVPLVQLERMRGPYGVAIERDLYWKEQSLREVRAEAQAKRDFA